MEFQYWNKLKFQDFCVPKLYLVTADAQTLSQYSFILEKFLNSEAADASILEPYFRCFRIISTIIESFN